MYEYFKVVSLFSLNVLTVYCIRFISIKESMNSVLIEIKSTAVLTGTPITTRWIEQKLDHFDANETLTWKMRYYERLDYWKPNGPIFLFINGENEAAKGYLATGIMYDLAVETNGAMFLSEHRYYGKSQPLNITNVEDFKFLSVAQALADNANLLRNIRKNIVFKNSKTVVVGGSYAGNLAAWMRLIYPDLVDAAIASSAPVLAKRNFHEYLEVVSRDFRQYGTEGCMENIQSIFNRYDSLFKTNEGTEKLKKEENICPETNLTEPGNKPLFFLSKMSPFMDVADYNSTKIIQNQCSKLNKTHIRVDDKPNEKRKCNNYDFDDMIKSYYDEKNASLLSWTYQTCTEFGFFQTSTSNNQPFTKNVQVEWYDKLCTALFGSGFGKERVKSGVKKINEMYEGRYPNVTHVVFSNGELDPWSALGILRNVSDLAPAVFIPRTTHCRDLLSNSKGDDEELKKARKYIKYLIKKWIGADDHNLPTITIEIKV